MNIYVSNLGHRITDESLEAAFATYGAVHSSKVMMDGFTGFSRGFGYVDMPNESEAAAAILKINGCIIDGQVIAAAEAQPKFVHKGSYRVGNMIKK